LLNIDTYNVLGKDENISLFLVPNGNNLVLFDYGKILWILIYDYPYIYVDRTNWNGDNKCDFVLKRDTTLD
jgi:hypothetical protein